MREHTINIKGEKTIIKGMRKKRGSKRRSKLNYVLAPMLMLIVLGVGAVFLLGLLTNNPSNVDSGITMYYSPTCGCCKNYLQYLRDKGLDVKAVEIHDVVSVKKEIGIPRDLWSCHTIILDGYFVEGHVPFKAIKKLLNERPDIDGIALPGMPPGSPGMSGEKQGEFSILSLDDGVIQLFMKV